MKSLAKLTIALVILILIGIWSPWNRWEITLPSLLGYNPPPKLAGLKVISLSGNMQVYVDGVLTGIASKEEGDLELFEIQPGERVIRLTRESDPAGFYTEFNRTIQFLAGLDVVIAYELGPTPELSEGHILSSTPKLTNNPLKLNYQLAPGSAQLSINGNSMPNGQGTVENLDLGKQHQVKVSANGYETLEFMVLPETQSDRDKLTNIDLFLEVKLLQIPVGVTSS